MNVYQYLGLFFFISIPFSYFFVIYPSLPALGKLILTILFIILWILGLAFYIATTFTDPTDNSTQHSEVIFCTLCNSYKSIFSKHCIRCNKCALGFDHHCKWVNNCIASKNYRLFICMICSLAGLCIEFLATVAVALRIMSQESRKYNWEIAVVVFITVILLAVLGLLTHLIGFHWYLKCKGISTYQYIVKQRKQIGTIYQSEHKEKSCNESSIKTENLNEISRFSM